MNRRQFPLSRRTAILAGATSLAPRARADAALDAAEHGVRPDIGDEQSAAMQRALEESARRGLPLRLGPGRHTVTGLRIPAGGGLVGTPGKTWLVAAGRGPVLSVEGGGVSLEGISVEGLRAGGEDALLLARDAEDLRVSRCDFSDSAGNGVRLVGSSGRVEECRMTGCAEAGIFSLDGRAVDIVDNRVAECGNNGILVWQSESRHDGATVRGNRISKIRADDGGTGQNGNAINVFRAGGVAVVDNVIEDCAFSAVRNNAGADIVIARNRCHRLGEVALYVEFGFEGAIVSDNLVHGAAQGVSATNAAEGGRMAVISGNLIRDIVIGGVPEDRGIGIGVEADASVTGNVVDGAEHAGLGLGWGPYLKNVVAADNVIRRARYGVVVSVADGAGDAVISGNLIADARDAAIAGFAWHELVEPDLAGRAADFPHLTIAGNRTG